MTNPLGTWQTALATELVRAGVQVAAWVPDKRLAPIGDALAELITLRTLTREEECIGYAAGIRAAGGMPLVLMQNSGLGNSLNALSSLAVPYGLGFPLVVSMRGTLGERNPAQTPLGRTATAILSLLGIQSFPLHTPDDITTIASGVCALAEGAREVAAITLEPALEMK